MTHSFSSTAETSAIFRPLTSPALFSNTSSPTTASSSSPPPATPPPPTPPPAPSTRDDLGDDDSFSPDIVSGYHFNVPLHHQYPTPFPDLHHHHTPPSPDHDHRTDAVYDPLDDIGESVAHPSNPTHLSNNLATALHRPRIPTLHPNHPRPTPSPAHIPNSAAVAHHALNHHQRADDRRRERHARDKLDRATVEQVLDPRTRMILFRLLSKGRLRTLDGCVSTGKEANVYFATAAADVGGFVGVDGLYVAKRGLALDEGAPDATVAVKVFKTSILQFKDRERYVAGEFRFRRGGYQRGSNRKMVQQWAEKEFRNQMRLQEAGVPAPVPLLLKPPVLVMSFFGKDGWPAPRLKDAGLSQARLRRAYFRVCGLMRRMFRVAKLVHGDLSEYNMLYWKGEVIIIDVSQSVEDDHPMALDFLRRDCANVNEFFRRNGVIVLSVRELFDYVTGEHIGSEKIEEESALSYLIESATARDATSMQWTRQDDEVFMRSFIPRTLQEVDLHAQQFSPRTADELDQNLFAKLTGLTVTQKRERSETRWSKSRSVSDASRAANWRAAEDSEGVDVPNLEIPCIEPATVRTLPAPGKVRLGSSSPCTTNSTISSTMRHGDEGGDGGRYPKILEQIRRIDSVGEAGSSKHSEERERGVMGSLEVEEEEEGIGVYDGSEGFEDGSQGSLGGDVWIHKDGGDVGEDAFKGLTRKEWKKQVKAANRERRENKVPKHVKKRRETLAKRRRGTK